MCQEVFKIIQTMDLSQVGTKMALQCAPVITGIKISNLLVVSSCDEEAVRIILKRTGLVLGYPIEDVVGFIEHKGKNYLYSGYWKVYDDVVSKVRIFEDYENAKEELILRLADGDEIRSIMQSYFNQMQSPDNLVLGNYS